MTNLKQLSKTVVDRLASDSDYRIRFQKDPRAALKALGCPEDQIPEIKTGEIDFLELGMTISNRLGSRGGELGAIAVACVVI